MDVRATGIAAAFVAPVTNNHLEQALFAAIESRNLPEIERLLDAGVNVNAADDMGFTCLMDAAAREFIEAINLLVEKGADVNAVFFDGTTALMWAAECGNVESVRVLLDKGADPKIVALGDVGPRYEIDAVMVARENEHEAVADYIEKFIAAR